MAITKSAKKAHRASLHKRAFNVRRKRALTTTAKDLKKILDTDISSAGKSLADAYQAIDKAAKRGIIKKNTASRRKSRLAKSVAKATA